MEIKYGRKRSGIKHELKKKVEDWLESIDDKQVRDIAEKNVIITGGAIASMLLGEKVNDFDIYFRTKEATKAVATYYAKQFNDNNKIKQGSVAPYKPEVREETIKNIRGEAEERIVIFIKSVGVVGEEQEEYSYFETLPEEAAKEFAESLFTDLSEDGEKAKYRPTFMSQNAITLSQKMQLIIRFYGEPEQIHRNYDFAHAKCWYDYKNDRLELPANALEALLSRTLIYEGSLYPVASIFRMKKFIERGWRITAGQQLKIMWQISEIDLKDYNVLREQLTGVDMAYMYQLIQALQGVEPEKINSTYIGEIIDRIFE